LAGEVLDDYFARRLRAHQRAAAAALATAEPAGSSPSAPDGQQGAIQPDGESYLDNLRQQVRDAMGDQMGRTGLMAFAARARVHHVTLQAFLDGTKQPQERTLTKIRAGAH
jgi:hypothetical protein